MGVTLLCPPWTKLSAWDQVGHHHQRCQLRVPLQHQNWSWNCKAWSLPFAKNRDIQGQIYCPTIESLGILRFFEEYLLQGNIISKDTVNSKVVMVLWLSLGVSKESKQLRRQLPSGENSTTRGLSCWSTPLGWARGYGVELVATFQNFQTCQSFHFLLLLVVDDSPTLHFSSFAIPVGQQLEVESWFTSSASPWYIQASKLAGVTMFTGHQPPNKSKWSIFMVAVCLPPGIALASHPAKSGQENVIWR